MDGWQQGFLIPEGASGVITLEYEPAAWYTGALAAGAAGIVVLLNLLLVRRHAGTSLSADKPTTARPSWVLGTVALSAAVALVSGPYALVVPVLALVARFRAGILSPLALTAMTGAGVVAVTGAATSEGLAAGVGTFGHAAQALALLSLAAALVTLPARLERHGGDEPSATPPRTGVPAPAAPDAPEGPDAPDAPDAPTAPLPHPPGDHPVPPARRRTPAASQPAETEGEPPR